MSVFSVPRPGETNGPLDRARRRLGWRLDAAGGRLAACGAPPALLGWRWTRHAPAETRARRVEQVHAAAVHGAPLPLGVSDREALPDERGWWGFSLRDVPERRSGETLILELDDVRILSWREPEGRRDWWPALLARDGTSLDLREIRFRRFHAAAARAGVSRRIARGVWIAERVFHNHAHWLTAHLPKLVLLRERGLLDGLILPAERPAGVEASLRALGIAPAEEVATGETVEVGRLTTLVADRFRPELLRPVRPAIRAALGIGAGPRPRRKVWISRRRAQGRRLREEAALAPMLSELGFETIEMEGLPFEDQIRLMAETAVLAAPHGAGLANMMFMTEGGAVVEVADPAYPNPNFYALAAAMGHVHALVPARGVGAAHPLDRDLSVEPGDLRAVLETLG